MSQLFHISHRRRQVNKLGSNTWQAKHKMIGPGDWSPDELSAADLVQWVLDDSGYADDLVSGLPVLQSKIYTTSDLDPYPINVQVPCVTATNAVSDYINFGTLDIATWTTFYATFLLNTNESLSLRKFFAISYSGNDEIRLTMESDGNFSLSFDDGGTAKKITTVNGPYNDSTWRTFTISHDGATVSLTVDDETVTVSDTFNYATANGLFYMFTGTNAISPTDGSVSDLKIGQTVDDIVYHWPMQEGAGATIHNVVSNSQHGTLTDFVLVDAWAVSCPKVRDHCVEYGGTMDTGVFIPGLLDGTLAANGSALTIPKHTINPNALIDRDPFSAAGLSALGVGTPFAFDANVTNVAPLYTKFERVGSSNERDRLITLLSPIASSDINNIVTYCDLDQNWNDDIVWDDNVIWDDITN